MGNSASAFFSGSLGSLLSALTAIPMLLTPGMEGFGVANLIGSIGGAIGQGVSAIKANDARGAANRSAQEGMQLIAQAQGAQLQDMINGSQGPAAAAKAIKLVQAIQQGKGSVTAGMAGQIAGLGPANAIGSRTMQNAIAKQLGGGFGGAANAATHFGNPLQMSRRSWMPYMGRQGASFAGSVMPVTQQAHTLLNYAGPTPTGAQTYIQPASSGLAGQAQATSSYSAAAYAGRLTTNPSGTEMSSVGGAS